MGASFFGSASGYTTAYVVLVYDFFFKNVCTKLKGIACRTILTGTNTNMNNVDNIF
jgi:hypothetical protein